MNSWKPEVQVSSEPGWHGNNLRFRTRGEAEAYVRDLMWRWTQVTETRVVVSEDKPNYTWTDEGTAKEIKK
jgi:hypothetical protein